MHRNLLASLLLLLSLSLFYACTPAEAENQSQAAPIAHVAAAVTPDKPAATSIQWISIEEAAEKMKKEPRKLIIDVYTDWCGWCKKMDKHTFTDPKVAELVNKHFYAVKLDAEGKEPITLNGRTFAFKPEYKAHELAVALLNGQMSFPTTVYLDEQMNMITPVPGYLDAAKFSQILRYFGENHHKAMTWQEFEQK